MKRFCQIYNNKAHWIFEQEEKTDFAPNIVILDITGNTEIQEGWDYDEVTGLFSAPIIIPVEPQSYTPTNTEIAQMISDLQADLIISGVI